MNLLNKCHIDDFDLQLFGDISACFGVYSIRRFVLCVQQHGRDPICDSEITLISPHVAP